MPLRFGLMINKYSLTFKLLLLLLIGIFAVSVLQIRRGESILETVILDQTKEQALIFLQGLERQLQQQPEIVQNRQFMPFIQGAIDASENRNFIIRSLYIYDTNGKIVAHSRPGKHADKPMSGKYGDVLRQQRPFLGQHIEYEISPRGESVPKLDIITPIIIDKRIFGGIEAELDLRRTMQIIKQRDDVYESELLTVSLFASLALLVFIAAIVYRWLVMPVQAMGKSTALIADGKFDTRIEATGRDEIGTLALSINKMAESLEILFNEQETAYMEALKSLTKALEAKDAYTAGHSGRVAHYAKLLGKRIGLDSEQLKLLHQGALMHDLGKIGIADNILNKAGKLDDKEYEIMQKHPHYTHTIMRPLKRFKAFADIARWHHERWDGAGYPDGLAGEEIPVLARIVSIADTWDAMTGDRVYRKGMPPEKAISIIENERDSGQWDPHLVDHFIEMVRHEQHARNDVEKDMEL